MSKQSTAKSGPFFLEGINIFSLRAGRREQLLGFNLVLADPFLQPPDWTRTGTRYCDMTSIMREFRLHAIL